jgi:hypothetical protein
MAFDPEGDDVSKLGDSFGASNANFGASVDNFGESFANVQYSYQRDPHWSPPNEIHAEDSGTEKESVLVEDDSESTLSGATHVEGFGTEDAHSLSDGTEENFESNSDRPESQFSNSSEVEDEAVENGPRSAPEPARRAERNHDGNSRSPFEIPIESISSSEVAEAAEVLNPLLSVHDYSASVSADTTAPNSENSFSTLADEKSIGPPPSDAAKESLAKALQFLSADLESPKPAIEPISAANPQYSETEDLPDNVSSSSESEGQSDDDTVSDESNDPAKLFVKEAPLLRLENVTAQTRSTIPESKLNKSQVAGPGGWGWFAFGKKTGSQPSGGIGELPKGSMHSHMLRANPAKTGLTDPPQERAPPREFQPMLESLPSDFGSDTRTADGGSPTEEDVREGQEHPAMSFDLAPKSSRPVAKEDNFLSQKISIVTVNDKNAEEKVEERVSIESSDVLPSTAPMPGRDASSFDAQSEHAVISVTSVGACADSDTNNDGQMQATDSPAGPELNMRTSALLSPISSASSPAKKNKKKKSKDKKKLINHIDRRRRKTNRHGDEVSVGTMNVQSPDPASQFVVPKLFDEVSTSVEKRPWERALAMRKAQTLTNDQPMDVEHFIVDPALEKATEESVTDTRITEAGVENSELEPPAEASAVFEKGSQSDDVSENGVEESDDLLSLQGLQDLEMKFEGERKEVDFDDMWNEVDCDSKTKLEFQERKRGKEREKERKRIQREKAKVAKRSRATRRLRLFENHELERGYIVKPNTALSSEFLSALNRVFDEDATDDAGSCSDEDQSIAAETKEGTLLRSGASVVSLYLNDRSVSKTGHDQHRDSEDDRSMTETETSARASKSRRKSGDHPRQKNNSSRSSRAAPRNRKPNVDPAAIFEAELKRQQRVKSMSVSNLRQEMSDRRGTSVRLIQKEFAERKYKRGSGSFQNQPSPRQSFGSVAQQNPADFVSRNGDPDPFASSSSPSAPSSPWRRSPRRLVGGRMTSHLDHDGKSIPSSGVVSRGFDLASHMSRWEVGDHVTDLDDLLTVQMSPAKNFLTAAADLAANAASHLPAVPDLPPMPNLSVPNMPSVPNFPNMPSMPPLPNMPSMPSMPGMQNLSSVSVPSMNVGSNFGFAATFADMPLSTIEERTDDENEAGLLDGGWDDEDGPQGGRVPGGGGGGGGTSSRVGIGSSPLRNMYSSAGSGRFNLSSMKVPKAPVAAASSVASAAGKGLTKLKSVARLVPKLSLRAPGDGSGRQMTMMMDDDDRGLLG